MNNIVYKVTTGNRKSIISDWINSSDEQLLINELTINYPTLKWAYPRIEGAHILAFKTLESAQRFLKTEIAYKSYCCDYKNGLVIWEALSDRQIEYNRWENALPSLHNINDYKERLKPEIRPNNGNYFPSDTIYCDRIRLIKKLETHYYSEAIKNKQI